MPDKTTSLPVPVEKDLLAACETFNSGNLDGGGYFFRTFRVEMQTNLITERGDGGVLSLFRSSSTTKEDSAVVGFEAEWNESLYRKQAEIDAGAKAADITDDDQLDAQQHIWALGREWAAQLPQPGTEWNSDWSHWLGRVLRKYGYTSIGSQRINQRTLGWLEALVANER